MLWECGIRSEKEEAKGELLHVPSEWKHRKLARVTSAAFYTLQFVTLYQQLLSPQCTLSCSRFGLIFCLLSAPEHRRIWRLKADLLAVRVSFGEREALLMISEKNPIWSIFKVWFRSEEISLTVESIKKKFVSKTIKILNASQNSTRFINLTFCKVQL